MTRRRLVVGALALLLSACASNRPRSEIEGRPTADSFEVAGKIAVRFEGDGYSGTLRWQHEAARDSVVLYTPVGTVHARLSRDSAGAVIEMSDGKRYEEPDAGSLSRRVLGWELPLDSLPYWLFTQSAPGAVPARVEADSAGRAKVLEQSGWRVTYQAYTGGKAVLPQRLEMERPGLKVKLLVARWGEPAWAAQ